MPSPLQGLVLHAPANFIERGRPQLHDMKRIEHRDRVGQLVADRVRVATERVQCGVLDGHSDLKPFLLEPIGVSGPGPSLDRIEQPGMEFAVLVASQVHHHRDRLRRRAETRSPVGSARAR